MTRPLPLATIAACSMLMIAAGGCGGSGGRPTFFPEIQFQVQPFGGATFAVQSLSDGNGSHEFADIPQFNASGIVYFFLENAAPPYSGTFCRANDLGDFTVTLIVSGQLPGTSCSTSGTNNSITLTAMPGSHCVPVPCPVIPPTPAAPPADPEVRFDACSLSTDTTCADAVAVGGQIDFKPSFSVSVGDPFTTRLSVGTSPSFYFLEGARNMVSGVFRSSGGFELHAQVYVNQALQQNASSHGNLILNADL